MVATFLVDPASIKRDAVLLDKEEVKEYLQQRYEMLQIDAVLEYDSDNGYAVGYKKVRNDEFWVRGHIPGRPVMPGVLVIETAAQMASIHTKLLDDDMKNKFIGFSGVDNVKFRKQVLPGDDLYMVTRVKRMRSRSFTMYVQGLVNDAIVFEGDMIGMII